MKRRYNVLIIFFLFISCIHLFNMDMELLRIPGSTIIYYVLLALLALTYFYGFRRKYLDLKFLKKVEKFETTDFSISTEYFKFLLLRQILFNFLVLVMSFFLLFYTADGWGVALLGLIISIESILFLLLNKNKFKIIVGKKLIIFSKPVVEIIYMNNLKSMELVSKNYVFTDKQSYTDVIPKSSISLTDQGTFESLLGSLAKEKNIYHTL